MGQGGGNSVGTVWETRVDTTMRQSYDPTSALEKTHTHTHTHMHAHTHAQGGCRKTLGKALFVITRSGNNLNICQLEMASYSTAFTYNRGCEAL